MSKSPKNSTDLFKELNIAIGCEPSTICCRKVKHAVPAYNSKYKFNLGFKTTSSFSCMGSFNYILLSVMSIVALPV